MYINQCMSAQTDAYVQVFGWRSGDVLYLNTSTNPVNNWSNEVT
jgi:hypothetical protein